MRIRYRHERDAWGNARYKRGIKHNETGALNELAKSWWVGDIRVFYQESLNEDTAHR